MMMMMMIMIRQSQLKSYGLSFRNIQKFLQFRTLLSSSYSCENEWAKRLEQDDTLKHISTGKIFYSIVLYK